MGALLLVIGGIFVIAAAALFRIAASRAVRVKSVRGALALDHAAFSEVSFIGRAGVAIAGIVGAYLAVSLLFAFALASGGATKVDESSMRVMVSPNGPAARAGIANGDRILAVNDQKISDWPALSDVTRNHAGEEIGVEIEHDGISRVVRVTPGNRDSGVPGKILVGPYWVADEMSAPRAFANGLVMPMKIWKSSITAFEKIISAKQGTELAGPVAIVHETNKVAKDSAARGLLFAASLCSYFFFIPILVSIVTFPRRRKKSPERAT